MLVKGQALSTNSTASLTPTRAHPVTRSPVRTPAVSAGVLFSFLTGVPYGLQSASARSLHPSWWRVMFALSFVPCLAMAALWAWAAESPLW